MAKKEPRFIQFPDPVHGYIPVEDRFMNIIDSPAFQRLRSIEQGSFRPSFPGARHDRFIHSLGTYHLATIFVEHFFKNLRTDVKGIQLTAQEEKNLKFTFRYAALLHDLGHAPFSHTTENLFREKTDPATGLPWIWTQLCREIQSHVSSADYYRFAASTKEPKGASHEIMSAILLLRSHNAFTQNWSDVQVDPELAARMIIGYPYGENDVDHTHIMAAEIQRRGVKNCLIQLLNSKVMDVDRMDYLVRDTQMSGYVNAPVDLDCLGRSVTAVTDKNGWLVPAFRDSAISVIDTMFHAKLSHDAWVLAHPAGAYDAALREHCIRSIDRINNHTYIPTVFSVESLEDGNVTWGNMSYRLLCDADIVSDMKRYHGAPFDELFTRQLGHRRTPAWRSYFEFQYVFTDANAKVSAGDVYEFFRDLLNYLEKQHIFAFTSQVNDQIQASSASTDTKNASRFLHQYMDAVQKRSKHPDEPYSIVLIKRTNNDTMLIDPELVRIRFTNTGLPLRRDQKNYATYAQLRNLSTRDYRTNPYFYLYRHGGLGKNNLRNLRERLIARLRPKK